MYTTLAIERELRSRGVTADFRATGQTGIFVAGYALSRITVEFFREPDPQLGYLFGGWLTMGMLLSLPMLAVGLWALLRARRAAGRLS